MKSFLLSVLFALSLPASAINITPVTNDDALDAQHTVDIADRVKKAGDTMTGQLTLAGSSLTVQGEAQISTLTLLGGGIQFDISLTAPAHSEGLLFYDNVDKALAYHSFLIGVTAQIPEENWVRFFNNTGSTILNGKAVYLTTNTTPGGIPHGELAKADTEATARAAGLATIDVPSLSTGIITSFGDVRDFNTGALALGSVFLSATVAGDLTNTRPVPPNFETQMGHATIVGVSSGRVHLMVGPPTLGGAANAAILGSTQTFSGSNAFANPVTIDGSSLTVNGDLGVDSPTLFVDSTEDRVGIGTTAPERTFHVSGGPILLDNNEALEAKETSGSLRKLILLNSSDDIVIGNSSIEDTIFKTGTISEAFRITKPLGNMGLNDTTPDAQFEIVSKSAGDAFIVAISSQDDTTGNIFSILGDGNVGIGVASPARTFDVKIVVHDDIGPMVMFNNQDPNANDGSVLLLKGGSNNAASNILEIQDFNGNTDLVVLGTGLVGIGIANPAASALLDIVSTTKGLLIPRVTTVQKDAISSPAIGLQVFDTSKETKVVNTTIGWKDMGAGWYDFTLSHTAFQTAALNNNIELFSLPAGGTIERVMIKHSTAFAGTSITEYTISVGISGDLAKYASAFDVLQAVSDTTFQLSNGGFLENFGAATSVRIAAIAVGANLDQSTAGDVEVWVQTSVLQ